MIFYNNCRSLFVNIISYWKVWKSVRQLREMFYSSRGLNARWIFIKIRKLRSDNTILSVNASRNRTHDIDEEEHTALHAFAPLLSTNQLKNRQESHDKCRCAHAYIRWQYLAHTCFPHIKIFLSILRNTTAFANRKSRHVLFKRFTAIFTRFSSCSFEYNWYANSYVHWIF